MVLYSTIDSTTNWWGSLVGVNDWISNATTYIPITYELTLPPVDHTKTSEEHLQEAAWHRKMAETHEAAANAAWTLEQAKAEEPK